MKILKRIFAPREVRVALNCLDEFGYEFDCEAFGMVRDQIEKAFLMNYNTVISQVQRGISPHQQVCFAIANVAGDYVESGQFHLYRGVLNPLGPGGDLLKLFDTAIDKLVQIGAVDNSDAITQKAAIRESIKSVG